MTEEQWLEQKNKILQGLELNYQNLIAFKIATKSELVIMKDGKIVNLRLWENQQEEKGENEEEGQISES